MTILSTVKSWKLKMLCVVPFGNMALAEPNAVFTDELMDGP